MTGSQTDECVNSLYSQCRSCLQVHSSDSNPDVVMTVWDDRVGGVGASGRCVSTRNYSLRSVKRYLTVILIAYGLMGADAGSYRKARDWYQQNEDATVKYLGDYGYLQDASRETGPAGLMSKEAFHAALKRLQRMGHIPVTGVVDNRTLELMKKPRCGVKDNMDSFSRRRRRKRYVTAPSKWEKLDLTFRIINTTPDMSKSAVRRAITDAFRVWSEVTALTFTETINSDADILIQFAENYHHDGYPFDGKGSVLAHAFFPGDDRGGDTHFDDGETWTFNSTEGVDLFMVAAHEFGHALGLAHSSNTEALMYPWYQGYIENFKLPYDDVQGIQSLYGSKASGHLPYTPRPPPRRPTTQKPGITDRPARPPYKPIVPERPTNPCQESIDAITVIRTEVFVFKDDLFWRMGSNGVLGVPTKQTKFWYNIPEGGIDAVYERNDGRIVFFKGDRFWVYNSNYLVANFPVEGKPITEMGIDKEVKKIDAVFVWGYNKRTYLITGDMYWKLNVKDDNVEFDYPRDMSIWMNVPLPVDSAFQHWDRKTYFLQGDQFWEFYDNKMRTRRRTGRPLTKLLGCRNNRRYTVSNVAIDKSGDQEEYTEPSSASRVQILLSNIIMFVLGLRYLH